MPYAYGTEEWETAYRKMVGERLARAPKPYVLDTPEWAADLEKLIREDGYYKDIAKTWEGTVAIHMLADPLVGFNKDIYIMMDLWHGDCRSIRLVPGEAGDKAEYVVTGALEQWEAVVKKELDVVKAMMQGKIKIKGSLTNVLRHLKATLRLVQLAGQIETRFITELFEEDRAIYLNWFEELRVEFGF